VRAASDSEATESSGEDALGIDITRADPPDEVLDHMARVTEINSQLRGRGYELSFTLSADGCALNIELRDSSGRLLRHISADEAAAIVSEASVD
jgi:hypothetical protein